MVSQLKIEAPSLVILKEAAAEAVAKYHRIDPPKNRDAEISHLFNKAVSQILRLSSFGSREIGLCISPPHGEELEIPIYLCSIDIGKGPTGLLKLEKISFTSQDTIEMARALVERIDELKIAPSAPIPESFTLHQRTFVICPEMRNNLSGARGRDHSLTIVDLIKMVAKKKKALDALNRIDGYLPPNGLDWYFKNREGQIYNLVLRIERREGKLHYTILTGYWMPDSVARVRHKSLAGGVNYDAWVKNLPTYPSDHY